jgi:hypothetical protein
MGPGYFIIAILGCGDGSSACTPVATVPTHYATQSTCAAGMNDALVSHSDLDFPTLLAECRSGRASAAAEAGDRPQPIPAGVSRG